MSDADTVVIEYPVQGGNADYALLLGDRPFAPIEAKKLGHRFDKHDYWQVALYSNQARAQRAVLTDGDKCVFLNPEKPSQARELDLRLDEHSAKAVALGLLERLDVSEAATTEHVAPPITPRPKPA